MKDEKFQLTPDEVANLDPFGVRTKDTSSELSSILDDRNKNSETYFGKEIVYREKIAWNKVLGVDIDIPPIPDEITPGRVNQLKKSGFEIIYMPKLEIDERLYLISSNLYNDIGSYIAAMEGWYPNWKEFESLTSAEQSDPTNSKQLKKRYWDLVKWGETVVPVLEGHWTGVETVKKIDLENDPNKQITNLLKLSQRYDESYFDLKLKISENSTLIRSYLGLESTTRLNLPNSLEFNLLANRYEWNDFALEWLDSKMSSRMQNALIGGSIIRGGAGNIELLNRNQKRSDISFRLMFNLD